ncbi:MAG: methyl-accepting chemotaxis protein [Bosea sp. (in: a-proteobacteria)]|nr:methyl-accepting chemotaxis protein [Bosea sp. (in: a-proteobacteria)]
MQIAQFKLANLRINKKLLLVAAVPLLAISAQLSISGWNAWQASTEARSVAVLSKQAPKFGQVIHELQQERANSAIFLGARGQSFITELRIRRSETDKALSELEQAFSALDNNPRARTLLAARPKIQADVAELGALRKRIDALALSAFESTERYTAAIGKLTQLLAGIPAEAQNSDLNRRARAYVALVEGKELAGQERALGSGGFAAGRFDAGGFRDFVGQAQAQTLLLAQFRSFAEPALVARFDQVADAAVSKEIASMRQQAYASPFGGDISAVTGPAWLQKATARIDLLKGVEDGASEALTTSAEEVAWSAFREFLSASALAFALLVASLAAVWFVARGISRPIDLIVANMSALARGEHRLSIGGAERRDEIGDMAKALRVFQENAERIRGLEEQERAASAARLARAQSMEAVVCDVGAVGAAAAAGEFSARLPIEDADEQLQRLVAGINEINAVVDGATTEFAGALSAIAGGDLTSRIETAYRGRFADLKGAINETVDRLSDTVATIQTTSADVGLAAREINMGADDLSKRTEEQASSLEQTAATTEELAASVKASAQASKDAARIADEAMQAAENGGMIAGQAVDAMARIETTSQKISDIIRVIDDIAFQTNLLALNAAVEAARAGEAGKGFAVVASEVRTLAQRSGEAAKDISALISSSNTEVCEGVKLVRQAGDQLARILAASQKVAATIADISAASGEQANGIDEMSQAVAHLDEMTQQNAALSEQSAASANSLSGRIEQLNALVATFRTGREATGQAAYAQPTATAPRAMKAPVRAAGRASTAAATSGEPERLRQLAEATFVQSKAMPAPRKVANGGARDAGWAEF